MKMTLARSAVAAIAVSCSNLSVAEGQTLEETLAAAYQNNPTLLAERARLRATDEGVPQALSGWRPVVTISGDAGWERDEGKTTANQSRRTEYLTPYGGTLSVDQNIYRGGRTVAATKRAEADVRAGRAQLSATEQQILFDAVTAHADVVRDRAVVALNKNNVRVLERQLEATQDRLRIGELTRTDLAQAESRLSRARADLTRAEGDLVSSRAVYANVVGRPAERLGAAAPATDIPAEQDEAISLAREKNFEVMRATFLVRSTEHTVREVIGELLPTVSVTASLSSRREDISRSSESDSASVLARVTIPLYQSGAVSSRVREAKQVLAQRRDERAQAIRDAVQDATRAWEALETARANIRSFTDEQRATQVALEGTEQEARAGTRTVLDVLDAEQEVLDASVNLERAQRDAVVASYQLRVAVGRLTAESLDLPVARYDPTRNYQRVRGKWFGLGVEGERRRNR